MTKGTEDRSSFAPTDLRAAQPLGRQPEHPAVRHWGPLNPDGASCRFCENPPFPLLRNDEDVRAYCACFDARWPPLVTRLLGLTVALDRAAR